MHDGVPPAELFGRKYEEIWGHISSSYIFHEQFHAHIKKV